VSAASDSKGKLGILVGGGPAPGINGVIGAATIEAINNGLQVYGLEDGFKWLCKGDSSHIRKLEIHDVSRIHFESGSILGTARENPRKDEQFMNNSVSVLRELGLSYLVTIGGDDTASSAAALAEVVGNSLRVAHVPKTIDNDLQLPGNMPTFGFQTARHVGVSLVKNLMVDALTTTRWYLVVCMGRNAGHLTLGIGKAAGATVSVIAEEFPEGTITLDQVGDVLEGAIIKRCAMGLSHGVALVAEGIGERLDPNELKDIPGVEVEYDDHGHLELREVPLARVLSRILTKRLRGRNANVDVVDVTLGYELRCAPPIPFDSEYCRDLGWGAVTYLLSLDYRGSALVCLDGGRLRPLPFEEVIDRESGRARTRLVDVQSESYQVALEYMIRLKPGDLKDEGEVSRLAQAANMTKEEFHQQFDSIMGQPMWRADAQ
jgi:6-phosphofructokinase 1